MAQGIQVAVLTHAGGAHLEAYFPALAATQAEIVQADRMVAEATAAAVLASLPPTKPGTITVTPLLTRFRGSREWSVAHVASVERFFSERFHHALPVSALGQTPAHDRLGFDHRNAMDVAVHPDRQVDVPGIDDAHLGSWLDAPVGVGAQVERHVDHPTLTVECSVRP